jgi:hypothetical protein
MVAPSKIRNNAIELNKIQYIDGNNRINFTTDVYSNGSPIADATAGSYANSGLVQANSAYGVANSAALYANGSFAQANAAFNSANNVAPQIQPAFDTANSAALYANGAFIQSNTKLSSSGGTVNGDLAITGNLIVSGSRIEINTATVLLNDNIVTINSDLPTNIAPTENAGIEINRGSSPNVALLWNESTDSWTFTNDGTNYEQLGGGSAGSYANSAFIKANAAYAFANTTTAWGTRQAFVATAGQTVFSPGSGYLAGYIDVYYNGLKLYGGEDYTATDGINVTLASASIANDIIEIVGFGANVPVANVYVLNSMASLLNRQTFYANSGQTTFTVTGGYRVGYVDVYYNGIKVNIPDDVTAGNGTTVEFVTITPTGNSIIEVVGLTPNVAIANAIPITGGTISGGITLAGNVLPSSTNTYYLGSDTQRWHSLFVGPGSIDLGGLILSNSGGTLAVSTPGSPATPIAGEDTWVRAQANASFLQANASFNTANNVGPQIAPAFNAANSASLYANGAFIQTNAAFTKANSGVQYGANTSSNSFIAVPSGTTAERIATSNGSLRYNTTLGQLETYFTSGGWIGLVRENFTAEAVVVAGGGGGGAGFNHSAVGSGGGAGGYLYGTITNISFGATYTIIIGAGGVGGAEGVAQQGQNSSGQDGSNSSITFGGVTLLNSIGGGGGVTYEDKVGRFGGSGSGGSGAGASQPVGGSGVVGPPRQGYPGGSAGGSGQSNGTATGGGGGGAGGIGGNGVTGGAGGAGGIGTVNSFDGSTLGQLSSGLYYLAGGGGGGTCGGPGGTAGLGGGGAGGTGNNNGSNGTTNTGGGAGGAGNTNSGAKIGGTGGSGVIIIRYLGPQRASGGTVTSNGSYTYHTFTGSGSFIA